MSGPWEKYAAGASDGTASGPWDKYGAAPQTATPSTPPDTNTEKFPDKAAISAPIKPGEQGHFGQWLANLESDIRYGGESTIIGKVLKKMGATGVNVGSQASAGDDIASLPLGAIRATRGIARVAEQGDVVGGAKDYAAGVLQGSSEPLAFAAPEVGEAAQKVAGKVSEGIDATKQAFSKTAATRNMQSEIGESLDRVAKDAGLPASKETSVSRKAADVTHGLKKQAQEIYGNLDKASGGRYQRFRDEIDEITDALKNKYTTPDAAGKLKERLAQVNQDYANVQKELVVQGVDPATIKSADAKWAQAKALEQVGKKLRVGESWSGDLKPGTKSLDTGLKNTKDHILPQATKNEAAPIKESVTNTTKQYGKVERNQRIAKGAAAVLGIGAGTAYGTKKLASVLSGEDR